jgi:hypothetical protein
MFGTHFPHSLLIGAFSDKKSSKSKTIRAVLHGKKLAHALRKR